MWIAIPLIAAACFFSFGTDAQNIIPMTMIEEMKCCRWAAMGQCGQNPKYMRVNCQTACGTPGATVDKAEQFHDNIAFQCRPENFFSNSTSNTEFVEASSAKRKRLQHLLSVLSGRRRSQPKKLNENSNETQPVEISFQLDPLTAAVQAGLFTPQTRISQPNTLTVVPAGSASPAARVPVPLSSFPSLIPPSGLPNLATGSLPQLSPTSGNPSVQTLSAPGGVTVLTIQPRPAATSGLNLQRTLLAAPNGAFGSGLPVPSMGLPDPNAILLQSVLGNPPPIPLPQASGSNAALLPAILAALGQPGTTISRINTSPQSGITSTGSGGINPLILAALLNSG